MGKYLLWAMGLVTVCFAVTSCGPKAGLDLGHTATKARELAAAGNVDQAIEMLEPFFNSRHYKPFRPAILTALLEFEVGADRTDEARKRFLAVVSKSPELAMQAFGIIERALMAKGKYQEMVDWSIRLRSLELGDAALTSLAKSHVQALVELGRRSDLIPAPTICRCSPSQARWGW